MACCSPLWYCTTYGLVKVLPDTEGHYTKPPGYRSGPYESLSEANAVCPLSGSCDDPPVPYSITEYLNISVVNCTGCFTGLEFSKTIRITPYLNTLFNCCGFRGECIKLDFGTCSGHPVYFLLTLLWCRPVAPPPFPAPGMTFQVLTTTSSFYPAGVPPVIDVAGPTWTSTVQGYPASVSKSVPGVDQTIGEPVYVFRLKKNTLPGGDLDSFDVYIVP